MCYAVNNLRNYSRRLAPNIRPMLNILIDDAVREGDQFRKDAYNAGFDNGVKATLEQLDGLITSGYDLKAVIAWIDNQWKEFEL